MKLQWLVASVMLCRVAMAAAIEPSAVAEFLARPLVERKAILADPMKKAAFAKAAPYSVEAVPHCFRIPTVRNMRDIGGWTGLGGRKVRFGRAYRSAEFNSGTKFKSGRDYSVVFGIEPVEESEMTSAKFGSVKVNAAAIHELVGVLGIRTDLDLRSPHEVYGMTSSPLGSSVRWVSAPMLTYSQLSEPDAMKAVAAALRVFAAEKNYPIIFHCAGGADRTGAVAFLVNGLCGVSVDDLARDWELTAFGTGHAKNPDFIHASRFDPLVAVVEKYPGATLADRIYAYLLACGLGETELEAIRRLMLEPCAAAMTPYPEKGFFERHHHLALNPAFAQIVKGKDADALKGKKECPLALPDEIDVPADWSVETNIVYVTDLYWYPYVDVRAIDPYMQFTVPAALPKKPALPLSAWDRMPSDYITVLCTSGRADEPPPEFFLRRGFRVRLDGRDLPLKTEPSTGARKILEIRPRPGNPRNSEGDFIRLKDGTLLFAWSCYYEAGKTENSSWDNGGANIVCRRSSDNGETWTAEDETIVRNDAMNVMSVSFLRLNDGRLALFYIRKLNSTQDEILLRTSADEAKTWSEAVKVTACVPIGWYVLNNARVIQLKSGRILVPLARHAMKDGRHEARASLVVLRSDDAGASWRASSPADVADPDGTLVITQEPGVIELKDGRVMMWARTSSGSQYVGHSSDGGETWGAFGPSGLIGPCSPATVRRLKSDALVAVWNDHRLNPELAPRGRRAPLSVALSHDEGKTWGASVPIEENLTDFLCYTALYERDDGILLAYCSKQTRNLDSVRLTFVPFRTIGSR